MNKKTILANYLNRLGETTASGDAREESFYPSLEEMLTRAAQALGLTFAHVTTLPKKTEAGCPDFRVWDGKEKIVGYLEAKKPGESLDHIEQTEQLRRYRETFPNLILTDFLEFRLYRNGDLVDSTLLGRNAILAMGKAPPAEKPDELWKLLEGFFDFSVKRATTAEELAVELARRTRFLREVIAEELFLEQEGAPEKLTGFYDAFQKYLIGDLSLPDFADLYAQTVTYGMFAARTRAQNGFNRRLAFDNIPRTIGILRDLFRYISLEDPPEQLAWVVDDIAEVLAAADARGILDRYFHEGKGADPIVHFYETFLAKYDPEERERRGVYYTPEPVVSYIVRSLHLLLKEKFNLKEGLASEGVTLLDPAAGTMTFIARAVKEAVAEFEKNYGAGARGDFIKNHTLKNFHAFELMMAPYAVGHLKMSFLLEELGHRLADDERVSFYLTNTLDLTKLTPTKVPGLSSLSEESQLAGEIKEQTPILVILGNPPYSGHSSNRGPWITTKIEDYKKVDGKPLGEKNPKWLQDDYVKFLRFAQWKIDQAGHGIVGMITNHSYLDNPTFRGMRQSLMNSFDEIYLLDLHGNSLKKETCPDGSQDQNVFDIRQGVAIALLVKYGVRRLASALEPGACSRKISAGKPAESKARASSRTPKIIQHADLYGTRDKKYAWLEEHEVMKTRWTQIQPHPKFHLFVPWDEKLSSSYEAFIPIPKIFPVNSVGIVTARDKLTIHRTKEDAWKTVTVFSKMEPELARQGFNLGKDVRDWKVSFAQKDLLESGPSRELLVPILYRPFDVRYTYYTGKSRGFICMPRPEVMRNMLKKNLALMTPRRVEHVGSWQHALVCDTISEHVAVSLKTIDYHFPLYLYPMHDTDDLISDQASLERRVNLSDDLLSSLGSTYGREPAPEEIFNYIYAVLYVPHYREKYSEFLRRDFPRIPFTKHAGLFKTFSDLGRRLVELHLLHSSELDPPSARFEGSGESKVGKGKAKGLRYDPKAERVYINESQYFAPVPPEVWGYRIGAYQVCEKWLKDKKDQKLGINEVKTYLKIVTALKITLEIQSELDDLYPGIEKEILKADFC